MSVSNEDGRAAVTVVVSDFLTHTCVSVRCGTCKETYSDDDYGIQHFDSREAAVKAITEVGWKADGDSARCRSCALPEECAQKGHVWDDWWACRCGCHHRVNPMTPDHVQPMECRYCARCDAGEEREMSE